MFFYLFMHQKNTYKLWNHFVQLASYMARRCMIGWKASRRRRRGLGDWNRLQKANMQSVQHTTHGSWLHPLHLAVSRWCCKPLVFPTPQPSYNLSDLAKRGWSLINLWIRTQCLQPSGLKLPVWRLSYVLLLNKLAQRACCPVMSNMRPPSALG